MKQIYNLKKLVAITGIFAVLFPFNMGLNYAQGTNPVKITIDPAQPGPEINRHIFGHFAEHLGFGIYGGIWVGTGSDIPNTRGIRNDVVEALKALKVPNVRWPGGCFADQYHWRDAIVAALNFNIFVRHAERVHGANIAQMFNVLQAVIHTDDEKIVLTPTYHAFRLYVPFQDATRLLINFDEGKYQIGDIDLPRLDAIAAIGKDGQIYVAITNIDSNSTVSVDLSLNGHSIVCVSGETLYAPSIDAINTFEKPDNVSPKAINATVSGNNVSVTVQPQSLTVL